MPMAIPPNENCESKAEAVRRERERSAISVEVCKGWEGKEPCGGAPNERAFQIAFLFSFYSHNKTNKQSKTTTQSRPPKDERGGRERGER